jgi:dTDP-4-dehydrorhamnose reductase
LKKDKRLVYISTDYVYPGKSGNYTEDDDLNPRNNYAWTKLAGECSTRLVKNSLIIRTSFGSSVFPYESAYNNLYTSKDYVDVISPMIYELSVSDLIGTINVGTERKSVLEYANRRNNILSKSLPDAKDFSLNLKKMMSFYDK